MLSTFRILAKATCTAATFADALMAMQFRHNGRSMISPVTRDAVSGIMSFLDMEVVGDHAWSVEEIVGGTRRTTLSTRAPRDDRVLRRRAGRHAHGHPARQDLRRDLPAPCRGPGANRRVPGQVLASRQLALRGQIVPRLPLIGRGPDEQARALALEGDAQGRLVVSHPPLAGRPRQRPWGDR